MYSAAMSPPRWPVPRPSRRSWERKRTWVSILSGRMLCMAAMAAGGRCEPKCFSARGFGGFSCADTAAIENRTAASTAILRMFKWGLEAFVVKEYSRIVNGNRMEDGTIGASSWGNFARDSVRNFAVTLAGFRLALWVLSRDRGISSWSLNQRGNRGRLL